MRTLVWTYAHFQSFYVEVSDVSVLQLFRSMKMMLMFLLYHTIQTSSMLLCCSCTTNWCRERGWGGKRGGGSDFSVNQPLAPYSARRASSVANSAKNLSISAHSAFLCAYENLLCKNALERSLFVRIYLLVCLSTFRCVNCNWGTCEIV